MKNPRVHEKPWVKIPPWVIVGAVLILTPIFVFMTLESLNRQKENTTRLLVEKGAALIRSFEAGTRTGMMGMHGGAFRLQTLLVETAQQADIVHLIVTNSNGTILADNELSRIGKTYGTDLDLEKISRSRTVRWRYVQNDKGARIFEVFREFSPVSADRMGRHRGMMRDRWRSPMEPERMDIDGGQIIFVGLDTAPVEKARHEDARHTVLMGVILLLLGFAGVVSLFLAQAYRSTKTSLSRVKAFSDNLVENMPIGLVAINADGTIASFNQTAESLLQRGSRQVLGKKPQDVLPPSLWKVMAQLEPGRDLLEKQADCPVSEGKTIPLDIITSRLEDENAVFLGYLILFRDLTEIQALRKEIETSQRLASIGRLAAGVAHEIRNPLSSIKGFATYFSERYRDVAEDQKIAGIMIQEVERLNRIISQLLEFAKPMELRKKAVSIQTLAQHTLRMLEDSANQKGIKMELKAPPDLKHVWVDPDKMNQVLLNLYLNAIESMENGGVLSVEMDQEHMRGTRVMISDTGAGINEEHLDHVFDPYFTTKPTGTGLGLAIVHRIIESHGGEVKVQSHPGKGTTVSILLPFKVEADFRESNP